MEVTLTEVLTDLLRQRLPDTKIGIVIRSVQNIDPVAIASVVAADLSQSLAVAVVGYSQISQPTNQIELAKTIEAATSWRNRPGTYAGRILVFVARDMKKLGSLEELDALTTRDVSQHLIAWAEQNLTVNEPQKRFWRGLSELAATLPYPMLEAFTRAVADNHEATDAIPTNLWRMGLLDDPGILDMKVSVGERLGRNRELITAIGELSDKSRKRISQLVRSARGVKQQRLRQAAQQLRAFFDRNEFESLRGLQFDDVAYLLESSKSDSQVESPLPSEADSDDDTTLSPEPPSRKDKALGKREFQQALANHIVGGGDPESVDAYLQRVRNAMQENPVQSEELADDDVLDPITGGREIQHLQPQDFKQQRKLHSFVIQCCAADQWGGVVEADQEKLDEIIRRVGGKEKVTPFKPAAPLPSIGNRSLIDLLRAFDNEIIGNTANHGAITHWENLQQAREHLLEYSEVLLAEPIAPIAIFYNDSTARNALHAYLDSYTNLLEFLREHTGTLSSKFRQAYQHVIQALLRLDVIFIRTPSEWKAMLTPFHPLHLWSYREILQQIGTQFTATEQKQLAAAMPELPHLLHFVVPVGLDPDNSPLPQAGSFETLPIYENRTNRYLGDDGIDFLEDVMRRWVIFASYSRPQIRVALIDIPILSEALRAVTRFLRTYNDTQVVLDVYTTRAQSLQEHLAEMDFEGKDSGVAEHLLNGAIVLNLFEAVQGLSDITTQLAQRPVHIVYSFDQSEYSVATTMRQRQLLVSPLVVSYEYDYDHVLHRGEISPSSDAESGPFANYHYLMNQAVDIHEGQRFQVQLGSSTDLGALNELLRTQSTRWLAVADRLLTGYAPEEAVPLQENLRGRREVAVWARATSRVMQEIVDLLGQYNLYPDATYISQLMRRYGHIAAGGLFRAIGRGNQAGKQRENNLKGLIGTVIAAHWYTSNYRGALIASLDSGLARQWLNLDPLAGERADLIGLHEEPDGTLILDIIEVKSRENIRSEARFTIDQETRQRRLEGKAVEQLRSTLRAVEPVFGDSEENSGLFMPARRESLKYQLYRECFREVHADTDQQQWYQRLNAAFRELQGAMASVQCRGMVIHVQFETAGQSDRDDMTDGTIRLVTLSTPIIQGLIVPPDETLPPVGNNTSDPLPDTGSDTSTQTSSRQDIRGSGQTTEAIEQRQNRLSDDVPEATPESTASSEQPPPPAEEPVSSEQHSTASTSDKMPEAISDASSQQVEVEDANTGMSQQSLSEDLSDYARRLERALTTYSIQIYPIDPEKAQVGPSVIRFLVDLRGKERLKRVQNIAVELQRELELSTVPFIDNVPATSYVGIDIPRSHPETVQLLPLLQTLPTPALGELPIIIGRTPDGQTIIEDMSEFPHLLVAGATNSGKSVFLRSLLLCLMKQYSPGALELLIIDPKQTDFSFFDEVPHLRGDGVLTDRSAAKDALLQLVREEMPRRQQVMRGRSMKIKEFNRRYPNEALPPVIALIDEYALLITIMPKKDAEAFEQDLMSLAAAARSTGIHLILATQRPSADVITGTLSANLEARIAFKVASAVNSRIVIDQSGAENLLGRGDMLFRRSSGEIVRAQAPFVSEEALQEWLQMRQ